MHILSKVYGTHTPQMHIDLNSHLVVEAIYQPSPNCDARPQDAVPELIVMHGISLPPGEYGGGYVQQFFSNVLDETVHTYFSEIACLKVSSHLFIERNGRLTQFVPLNQRAWHAGQSCYQGREACNDFSIGIELEGTDDDAYSEQQYTVLKPLIDCLQQTYKTLAPKAVVGHSDIAPGRKTDPGTSFDWARIR